MYQVYILRSLKYPNEIYKGFTERDVYERLIQHNSGKSPYTSRYLPWGLVFTASFEEKKLALDFEKYLKSASGIAFLRKRLIQKPKNPGKIETLNNKLRKF